MVMDKCRRRTIWIGEDIKRFIEAAKVCPSETYDHALRRLLKLPGKN